MQNAIAFGERYVQAAQIQNAKVTALPRPPTPFNWMVIVETPEVYHYTLVSLSRTEAPLPLGADASFFTRVAAPYMPLPRALWVEAPRWGRERDSAFAREAMGQLQFEFFRWFSRYPVLLRTSVDNSGTCAWFQDLRFLTPGRASWPFRYGMCRGASGEWRPYELLSDNSKTPVY